MVRRQSSPLQFPLFELLLLILYSSPYQVKTNLGTRLLNPAQDSDRARSKATTFQDIYNVRFRHRIAGLLRSITIGEISDLRPC